MLTPIQIKSMATGFDNIDDSMTHYFITGKESWEDARTNRIVEAIAGTIKDYYKRFGLYGFIPKLNKTLGKVLSDKEKGEISAAPGKEVLKWLWKEEKHSPTFHTEYSSGVWSKAENILAELLIRRNDDFCANTVEQIVPRGHGTMPFDHLPGEIRNKIYRYLVTPSRCVYELSGHRSDFYESQMLLLNHKINKEVLAVWCTIPLQIHIGEEDVALYEPSTHMVSSRLLCERLTVAFSLADDRKLVQCDLNVVGKRSPRHALGDEYLLGMIHRLSFQISQLCKLQEFGLSSSRLALLGSHHSPAQPARMLFPDQYFECFKLIRGLRRVDLEGDLDQGTVRHLKQLMTEPKNSVSPAISEEDLFDAIKQHQCLCMRIDFNGFQVSWLEKHKALTDLGITIGPIFTTYASSH